MLLTPHGVPQHFQGTELATVSFEKKEVMSLEWHFLFSFKNYKVVTLILYLHTLKIHVLHNLDCIVVLL